MICCNSVCIEMIFRFLNRCKYKVNDNNELKYLFFVFMYLCISKSWIFKSLNEFGAVREHINIEHEYGT